MINGVTVVPLIRDTPAARFGGSPTYYARWSITCSVWKSVYCKHDGAGQICASAKQVKWVNAKLESTTTWGGTQNLYHWTWHNKKYCASYASYTVHSVDSRVPAWNYVQNCMLKCTGACTAVLIGESDINGDNHCTTYDSCVISDTTQTWYDNTAELWVFNPNAPMSGEIVTDTSRLPLTLKTMGLETLCASIAATA